MDVDGSTVPTSVAVPGGVALFTSSLDKANASLKEVMLCGDEMGLRSSVFRYWRDGPCMALMCYLSYIGESSTRGSWGKCPCSVTLQRISLSFGVIRWLQQRVHRLKLPQLQVPFCGDYWGCPMWGFCPARSKTKSSKTSAPSGVNPNSSTATIRLPNSRQE